jgi:hypothetical protein
LPLTDILHDRAKLLRLLWWANWASIALIALGVLLIMMDFIG